MKHRIEYELYCDKSEGVQESWSGHKWLDTWDTDGDPETVNFPGDATVEEIKELPVGSIIEIERGAEYRIRSRSGWEYVELHDINRSNERSIFQDDENAVRGNLVVFTPGKASYIPESAVRMRVTFEVEHEEDISEGALYGFKSFEARTASGSRYTVRFPEDATVTRIDPLTDGIYTFFNQGYAAQLVRRVSLFNAVKWQWWNTAAGTWSPFDHTIAGDNEGSMRDRLVKVGNPL